MAGPQPGKVVVVGSIHLDIQLEAPRLPGPGETVLGTGHRRSPGGKGANQAVAAATSGAEVTFVGRVGRDVEGNEVLAEVAGRGVSVEHITIDDSAPTGLAFITVDPEGNNQISVSPGASGRLSPDDLRSAIEEIRQARVLLLQLEVPLSTVRAAIEAAGDDTTVVLNPAPAVELPDDVLHRVDVLAPNLVELGQLSGRPTPQDVADVADAARSLAGEPVVVVTMGGGGVALVRGNTMRHVAAEPVEVVDTTGAGDAFCGAFAGALARGCTLEDAVVRANSFAGWSTTRPGALSSYRRVPSPGNAPPGAPEPPH